MACTPIYTVIRVRISPNAQQEQEEEQPPEHRRTTRPWDADAERFKDIKAHSICLSARSDYFD